MKIQYISLFVTLAILIGSCTDNKVEIYDGPSQVHFLETKGSLIVDDTDPVFEIEVGVSKAVDQNRSFEVVIDEPNSTAQEGVDFILLNNIIEIPAGEVIVKAQVKGLYDGAKPFGSTLALTLRATKADEEAAYNNSYKLDLFKFCDFDRDAFIGSYHVFEHAYNGEFEYDVEITAGDDPFSVFVDGLWDVKGSKVKINFERSETNCSIPAQFFFEDLNIGYENVWIRSLSNGTYNACMGSIENLEYFIYPGDSPNQGWDRGTFDMYKK